LKNARETENEKSWMNWKNETLPNKDPAAGGIPCGIAG
jgi:hypothetical protein